ncbi:hypothetical protein AK830_g3974 [Neonectria ditissima]|uniref:LysM domain-containing protein n=1 Tax=Neonectria ditissima TaxID=78410 RepID=A0A0P7BMD6_9HYPO|nr:hypothetical protein AK830_g3974 [Neonectria ditissima]
MALAKLLGAAALLAAQLSPAAAADVPINTPSPMLQPAYPACEQFHLASVGQDCNALIAFAQITRAEFFRINPAVDGEKGCADKILANTWYCVKAKAAHPALSATANPGPKPTKGRKDPHGGAEREGDAKTRNKAEKPKPAKTKKKDPKITKAPVPNYNECVYGDCWYAFGSLSKGDADKVASASSLCKKVFAEGCKGDWDWPGKINKLCDGCKELKSACPCFLAGHYHTRTVNHLLYSRKGDQDQNDWLPSDE